MKVNRLELIDKLRTMVAQREVATKERKEKALDEASGAERRYVDQHAGDWGKFATTVRMRLRQGRAITAADVPEGLRSGGSGWHASVQLFRATVVKDSDYLPRTEPLTRLIAVLESSPDEFISTSALDRIGAPLKELMRS